MVSLFIDENASRLEYVWINFNACFFVCVYVVRDYVDIVKALPNKPPFDLRYVSSDDWFTSKKEQNLQNALECYENVIFHHALLKQLFYLL